MQQFMPSVSQLQWQFHEALSRGHDVVAPLPLGMGWLDILPLAGLSEAPVMTVVIYPTQSLLAHHLFRLRMMGVPESAYAALTADMSPVETEMLWARAQRRQVPVLMLTAKRLRSIKTLSQLARCENLGPLLVEQAHLLVPSLWGPYFTSPYAELPDLFKLQWPSRPPMVLLTPPLPPHYQSTLADQFALRHPHLGTLDIGKAQVQLEVKPCWTGYQKFKQLMAVLKAPRQGYPSAVVVVCQSVKAIVQLEKRLRPVPVVSLHHKLSAAERELRLMRLLHHDDPVILVETALMGELPLMLMPLKELQVVLWQLPWSCEQLSQIILPAIHANTMRLRSWLFYTRDDYQHLRGWLSHQLSQSPNKAIHLDHLQRLRHFCIQPSLCRTVQVQNWLMGWVSHREPCGACDVCLSGGASTQWRKWVHALLF